MAWTSYQKIFQYIAAPLFFVMNQSHTLSGPLQWQNGANVLETLLALLL